LKCVFRKLRPLCRGLSSCSFYAHNWIQLKISAEMVFPVQSERIVLRGSGGWFSNHCSDVDKGKTKRRVPGRSGSFSPPVGLGLGLGLGWGKTPGAPAPRKDCEAGPPRSCLVLQNNQGEPIISLSWSITLMVVVGQSVPVTVTDCSDSK